MNYRIETKEAFDIFGIETVASLSGEEGYTSPAQLWQQCHQNGSYEKLFEASGDLPDFVAQDLCEIHGAENYRDTQGNTFPYMLCSFVSDNSKTDGYVVQHVPAQTYAIFPSEKFRWDENFGEILGNLQKRFYSEWLPTANYERVPGVNFEIYGGDRDYGYIELWYPVRKKQCQGFTVAGYANKYIALFTLMCYIPNYQIYEDKSMNTFCINSLRRRQRRRKLL